MADSTVITPYSTAVPFFLAAMPTWLDEYNAQRLASYDLYDDLFANRPDQQMLLRGSDDKPIYVPTAKRVINTLARYVGKDWGYEVLPGPTKDPTEEIDADPDIAAARSAFSALYARERLGAQFSAGKKEWLRRGDWCWFVTADEAKPAGDRISIKCIDPRTYFPMNNDATDVDRVTGQQIVEEDLADDGKTVILKIQTYVKYTDPMHPNYGAETIPDTGFPIYYTAETYALKDWQDVTKRQRLSTITPFGPLDGITALPIYHIKNNEETGNPFGLSDLAGLESIVAGINQAISDEDLALAMAGLGMYYTDSGAPVDPETLAPTTWELGPGQVVEVAQGRKFSRIQGVSSVDPSQKHVDYLEEQAYGANGINDIALGTRGAVTESGVALAIRMQPLFDEADLKDQAINGILTQMFHDLQTMWFPAFEGVNFGDVIVSSGTSADRLPFDRAEFWSEMTTGLDSGILPLSAVLRMIKEKLGYDLTPEEVAEAIAASKAKAAALDPFARATTELNNTQDTGSGANTTGA